MSFCFNMFLHALHQQSSTNYAFLFVTFFCLYKISIKICGEGYEKKEAVRYDLKEHDGLEKIKEWELKI